MWWLSYICVEFTLLSTSKVMKVKVHVRQQHIFQLIQDVSKSLFRLRRRRIFSAPRPSDLILFIIIIFFVFIIISFCLFSGLLFYFIILFIFILYFCIFIIIFFVLLFFIYNYYFVRYQTCVWKLVDELPLTSENSFNTDQNEFCWVFKISASVTGEQCWRVGHVVVWW